MIFYEGGFGYDRQIREVDLVACTHAGDPAKTSLSAMVFVPNPDAQPQLTMGRELVQDPWVLEQWAAHWGAMSRAAARDAMARFGQISGQTMHSLMPFVRNRAWAQTRARPAASQELRRNATPQDVEFSDSGQGYRGFFNLRRFEVRHRRFDGTWSTPVNRECFEAFDAALVLPYDPDNDLVMLTEQLRFGPILRDDSLPWTLEPIAGMIDAGETPEQTAHREASEEAGLELQGLVRLPSGYAAPGYNSEYFHTFIGLCDLSLISTQSFGGLASENEDIRNHVLSFDAAMALIESGEINALPLVMMLYALAAHRSELRAP